ncbi:MAG: MazG nucleotide pyrophosphohydrolase domain-containing protein [Pseudonocardiaceae bacterium]
MSAEPEETFLDGATGFIGPYRVQAYGAKDPALDRAAALWTSPHVGNKDLAVALSLALLAADRGDVCIVGLLKAVGRGTACVLTVRTSDVDPQLAGARPILVRGTTAYDTDQVEGPTSWLPLCRIDVCSNDGATRDLAELDELERVAVLSCAGVANTDLGTRADDPPLTPAQRQRVRDAEREALVPLAKACGHLASTLAGPVIEGEAVLRGLQEQCMALYGRLEPERALAWALEELGELAQAMRRGESTVRLEEELGQVLVWALCLANITRVDAAHAFAKAYSTEHDRQMRKYGMIRPYRRAELAC